MTEPDPAVWKENASGRERVQAVVETLEAPASISQIADAANVAWGTADSELDRLQADSRVRERVVDGETRYEPNPVQQFLDQILTLIDEHDREELETRLVEYQDRLESLRDEYDATTAAEYRERLTGHDLSADEMREIRNVAATWEALETERRLVEQALNLYDDVTRFSDAGSTGGTIEA